VAEESPCLDLNRHVGNPEAHCLERTDRLTELHTGAGVGEGGLVGGSCDTDGECRRGDPPERQSGQGVEEAAVQASDEVSGRNPAFLEDELGHLRGAHPELRERGGYPEARAVALHQKEGEALEALLWSRRRDHDEEVRDRAAQGIRSAPSPWATEAAEAILAVLRFCHGVIPIW
jgi:hypothetical protein